MVKTLALIFSCAALIVSIVSFVISLKNYRILSDVVNREGTDE